jgi:hypothetical protein
LTKPPASVGTEKFDGSWPGVCLTEDERGPGADCFDIDIEGTPACGPQLACLHRTCVGLWQLPPGAVCVPIHGLPEGAEPPPVCVLGAACVDGGCL